MSICLKHLGPRQHSSSDHKIRPFSSIFLLYHTYRPPVAKPMGSMRRSSPSPELQLM